MCQSSQMPSRFAPCDLEALRSALCEFAEEREWQQFHTPRNLLLALVGEVGELSELFQWKGECRPGLPELTHEERESVGQELSDCLLYLVRMSDVCGIDLSQAAMNKLKANATKYPADQFRGSSAPLKHMAYRTQSAVTQPAPADTEQGSDAIQSDPPRDGFHGPQPNSPQTVSSNKQPSNPMATTTATAGALGGGDRATTTLDMSLGSALPSHRQPTSPFDGDFRSMHPQAQNQECIQQQAGGNNPVAADEGELHMAPGQQQLWSAVNLSAVAATGGTKYGQPTSNANDMPLLGTQLGSRSASNAYRPAWANAITAVGGSNGGASPARSMPVGRGLSDVRSQPIQGSPSFIAAGGNNAASDPDGEGDQKRKRFTEKQKHILTTVAEASGWSLLRVSQEDRDWLQEMHGITKDKLQNFLNNHKPRDFKGRRGAPLDGYPSLSNVTASDGMFKHLPPSLAAAQLRALSRGGLEPDGQPGPSSSSGRVHMPNNRSGPLARLYGNVQGPSQPISGPSAHAYNSMGRPQQHGSSTHSEPSHPLMLGSPDSEYMPQQQQQYQQQQVQQQQHPYQQQQQYQQHLPQQLQVLQVTGSGNLDIPSGINMAEFQGVMPNMVWMAGANNSTGGNSIEGGQAATTSALDGGMQNTQFGLMQGMQYGGMQATVSMNMGPTMHQQQQGNTQGKPMYLVLPTGQAGHGPMSSE